MNEASIIEGDAVGPSTIDVYALFGEFRIQGSPIAIHYASTFANPQTQGHKELLEELRPVRERLKAKDLRDLNSLLQRDLNDSRVAEDLIPYLQRKRAPIGFFPAVLAVLVPIGYLEGDANGIRYPQPELDAEGRITRYGSCWSIDKYRTREGAPLPMGRLRIIRRETQIIVLDGQHRSTAFRFLSGDFNPTDEIYNAFYRQVQRTGKLNADLPVTIIWFVADSSAEVDPKLISCRLFVDVNNSAKPVSQARTILLDDRTVTAVAVQEFYNYAAEKGFEPGSFSLLHSAFDMDTDLAKGKIHKFALTTPEIVEEALRWAFFSTSAWDALSQWRVKRLTPQHNVSRFAELFGSPEGVYWEPEEDSHRAYFETSEAARKFRERFRTAYRPILVGLFKDFSLLAPHYKACAEINEWQTNQDTVIREVWNRVFGGGEGLYWSFQRAGDSAKGYHRAIEAIENEFVKKRAELVGIERREAEGIYESFVSKAFQTGFVMAVYYLAGEGIGEGDPIATNDALLSALNKYSLNNWCAVFNQIRPLLIRTTTPREWPSYRTLLVRMFDGDRPQFFDEARVEEWPEWQAIQNKIDEVAGAIANTQDEMPDKNEIARRSAEVVNSVAEVFAACGLGVQFFESVREHAESYFSDRLAGQFSDTSATS